MNRLLPIACLIFLLLSLTIGKASAADESCQGDPVTGLQEIEVTKKLLSFSEHARPGYCGVKPTKIVMHTTWGIEDADGLWQYFETNPENRYASTHFVIGKDGRTLQMAELYENNAEVTWAVAYYNDDSISIELGHRADYGSKSEATQVQYNQAQRLVKKLMEIYDIPLGNIEYGTINTGNYPGQGPIDKSSRGIFGHYQLSPIGELKRSDPGQGFLRDFRADIQSDPTTPDIQPDEQNNTSPGSRIGRSNCVITKVGNPKTSPSPPPECTAGDTTPPGKSPPSKGEYAPPIRLADVQGIATEMASYGGSYDYLGHIEHAGLDIGAAPGKPVFAVADGEITYVRGDCANTASAACRFEITHNSGLISSYTHVNINPNSIRVGSKIKKGDQIATIHNWSMPHLHFEFQSQRQKDSLGAGININPRNYIREYDSVPFDTVGYGGNVRRHTNNRGIYWAEDGREFAETFRDHPPCKPAGGCWAH